MKRFSLALVFGILYALLLGITYLATEAGREEKTPVHSSASPQPRDPKHTTVTASITEGD
jgi:hypothetical protein